MTKPQWVEVECETAADYRALRRLCATGPKYAGASISAQPAETRFLVHDLARFQAVLPAYRGTILA